VGADLAANFFEANHYTQREQIPQIIPCKFGHCEIFLPRFMF